MSRPRHFLPVLGCALVLKALAYCIALAYAFSGEGNAPGVMLSAAGPVAMFVAQPVVWIQNAVPLGRPADTLVGLGVTALLEALIIGIAFGALRPNRDPENK